MNVTKLNRSGLNVSRLNASLLNASGIGAMGCKGKATMEDKIMSSMVLWYDLAKQGATNESMAADPRLIDHSGNGHDATCYNFAWAGKSGIGLYEVDCSTFNKHGVKYQINAGDRPASLGLLYKNLAEKFDVLPSFQAKITGVEGNNISSKYCYRDESGVEKIFPIKTDGTYTLPQSYVSIEGTGVSGGFVVTTSNAVPIEKDFSIEFLPLYPNALVSDGIDDYCLVEGLPNIHSLLIKYSRLEQASTSWKYLYNTEISGAEDIDRWYCAINQDTGVLDSNPSISDDGYVQRMNDIVTNNRFFEIFNYHGGGKGAFALYSLLLFNRPLTTDEIEWVKTNLIETEQ